MIIKIRKYLFIGAKEDLDRFFDQAQAQGFIEFIAPSGKKPVEQPADIEHLLAALKILRKQPLKKPYLGGGTAAYAVEIAHRILALKAEIERLREEERILEAEISRVAPFGDFSMDDLDFIEREGRRKIQFFCMKTSKSHLAHDRHNLIYIDTVYDLDYFIAIDSEHVSYPDMIEMRIDRPLGQLQNYLSFIKESLHLLEAELKGFAGHIDFLHHTLIELLNEHHLSNAKKEVGHPLEQILFSVEAWIPENKITALFGMLDGMAIHAEEIAIEERDSVPTCMQNKGVRRMGEDLVQIYDVPASEDKDPSGWVFWAFALFFAIIVADGGYGLLFLAVTLFCKYKFPKAKGEIKRFIKLGIILSVSCILWGVCTSSYFGMDLSPSNSFSRYTPLGYLAEKKAAYHMQQKDEVYQHILKETPQAASAKDPQEFFIAAHATFDEFKDNILLELSLVIGVIHISLSFMRYLARSIAGIGWIFFMVGGYLFFPSLLNATTMVHYLGWLDKPTAAKIGLQLVYGGVGVAMILALIQKGLEGISEVTRGMQVFADVLSYLRLYALALAGTMMASTFNDIGINIGLAAGIFAILCGHIVTIALGASAGIIHGLRLNFIEWYHHSFEGGGRLFNPLRKIK